MRIAVALAALIVTTTRPAAAPSIRAKDFPDALQQAKSTGHDIIVLQRGSDWNLLGEEIHRTVWESPAFLAALGDGFVLVSVDRPEQAGAPALGSGESKAGIERFLKTTAPAASLPVSEITAVRADGGASYKTRLDGALLVDDPKGEKNPAHDTISLTVRPRRGGSVLRLDFLPDPALPNSCAGRASNGNFAISEIELRLGEQARTALCAWANAHEANMPAAQLIDGIKDQPNNGWNPAAHTRQARSVMLALDAPVRAGDTLQVTLVCRSQWPNHVPACFRAAIIDDPTLAETLVRVTNAQATAARNAAFTWWDGSRCPRIAFLDSEGRAIAADDAPRLDPPADQHRPLPAGADRTIESLVAAIHKMRETRFARDEMLAKAEKAQGPERAELLRRALDVLGFANWPGNGDCYKPVHELIRQADPQDTSGATRWLGFSSDPKSGVPWAKPAWNEALDTQGGKRTLADADYQEALARVDKELADPRNKVLTHENIQRMMVAKFHIFRSWKGHEEERFRIQQEIAAFDPDTFWGIGARGYLGMYGKSETPFLTYGWKANQLKPGTNTWRSTDTDYFFDHPGKYRVTLAHAGGAAAVKIKRLALLDGDLVLAEAKPDTDLGPGPNSKVAAILDCSTWQQDKHYSFLTELEVPAGTPPDNSGHFLIEPCFEEPAPAGTPATTPDHFKLLRELREKLVAALAAHRGKLPAALERQELRHDLARHELIRRCGPESLDAVAAEPGGSAFLDAFTADLPWLESFLANDETKWPQALANLRFLHCHGKHLDQPLGRTLATAMALAAGDMNRYRLFDRYHDILRTHRAGLLHASFDQLDTREMRWAVLLSGTSPDYRWMVDTMQQRLPDYLGACWGIPYIDPNVYGYSVQGWGYVDPWTHHHGTGTGDRPFRVQRTVGGVCGTLSGFGSAVAKAHGIMATTVGQPGHCAYVVRIGQEWPTGNDVFGHETNGASVYEGTGFPTMHRLYEPVHANQSAFLASCRLAWAAHVLLDRRRAFARVLPGLKTSVYQLPGGRIDDIRNLKPVATGTADRIKLAPLVPATPDNFGVVWEGEVEFDGDGSLTVQVQSDDGSRLTIGNQTIPGNQAPAEIKSRKGRQPLRLEYGQVGGAMSLALHWSSPVAWKDDWAAAYDQAIDAHPIHYPLVLEYIKQLEGAGELPDRTWQKLIARITDAYAPYPEAAWALVNRCYSKLAPAMEPDRRLALLVQCHQRLTQPRAPGFMGFNFQAVLNTQADSLAKPELAVDFFQKLLATHFQDDPSQNRLFGEVMNWGRNRFAGNPATAASYAKAVGSFFSSKGSSFGADRMREQITAGIRKASESADLASWRLWNDMASRFLPPSQPGEVHLNPDQAKARPELPAASPLSKDGLLQTSSACQFDRPLSYRAVLDGSAPGWFDTNAEEKPWAQVVLAGDAEITGIIAVNRYEYQPNQEEFQWAAPFKVLLSTDGKAWTEVATCDKAEAVMKIDLTGKAARARYVRIERQAPADKSKPPGRLHLRNFLVYGKKLY